MHRQLLPLACLSLGLLLTPTAALHAAQGGPDAYGYTWADSNSRVPFEWIDITATGTAVLADPVPTAANFTLEVPWGGIYGSPVSQLRASRNGYLTDLLTDSGNDETNDCPLPAVPSVGGGIRIYPLHDRLRLDNTSGRILYQYFPSSPHSLHRCGVHVITWRNVYHFGGSDLFSFQVLLFDNLDVLFQYAPGNPEGGLGSTTGIQNNGATIGLGIYCNEKEISDNFAILIQPPTVLVNTAADEFDTPSGPSVSLREALRDVADGGRIRFHPSLDQDTLDIAASAGGLGTSFAVSAKSIAIDASNLADKFHLSTSDQHSHFSITNSGWLSCENLAFEKAASTGSFSLTNSSTLIASRCDWLANRDTVNNLGGAISLQTSSGTVKNAAALYQCDFVSNYAGFNGGAISAGNGSALRAEQCRFWRNQVAAGGFGGAVHLTDTAASLINCEFAINSATRGGAMFVGAGVNLVCRTSTFDDNRAQTGGAVIFRGIGGATAALFHYCTFFGNCASASGGAIAEDSFVPALDLDTWHCTFYKNRADTGGGAFSLQDATCTAAAIIMADNGTDQLLISAGGALDASFGDNLETGNEGNFGTSGGESNIADIALTDLGHFGGPVRVCMPLQACPAIDRAVFGTGAPLAMDARGFPTFRDGGPITGDIENDCGAVEVGPTVTVTSGTSGGAGSLQAALNSAQSGGVVAISSSVKMIRLAPAGITVPAGRTVFIDASPGTSTSIDNLRSTLSAGQSLALHAVHATATTPGGGFILTSGQFTAHACSFTGYDLGAAKLLDTQGSGSLLRSSACDCTGSTGLINPAGRDAFFVARDFLASGNSKEPDSTTFFLLQVNGSSACIQRTTVIENTIKTGANAGAVAATATPGSPRAWLVCENSTISSNDISTHPTLNNTGALVGHAPVLTSSNRTLVHVFAENNTIYGNRSASAACFGVLSSATFASDVSRIELLASRNIVANNPSNFSPTGGLISGGYNLSDSAPSFFTATDIPNTDPQLGPLVLGHETSLVHVPRPGSPCIDAVPPSAIPVSGCSDGRRLQRSFDADADTVRSMDIGAVESGRVCIVTTAADEIDGVSFGTGASLRECLAFSSPSLPLNIGFAPSLAGLIIQNTVGTYSLVGGRTVNIDGAGQNITLASAVLGDDFLVLDSTLTFAGLKTTASRISNSSGTARVSFSDCQIRTQSESAGGSSIVAYRDCDLTGLGIFAGGQVISATQNAERRFTRCTFHDFTTPGAYIMQLAATARLSVKHSTFARNALGAIDSDGANIFLDACTFTRNSGGLRFDDNPSAGRLTILRDCLSTNQTTHPFGNATIVSVGGNHFDFPPPTLALTASDFTHRAGYLAPLADYDGDGLQEMRLLSASRSFNTDTGAAGRPAAVITVTTAADQNDNPAGAEVSLREALRDIAEGGTITFDPALNKKTFSMGSSITIARSLTIDATSLPLGIDLTTRLVWTGGQRVAMHAVHLRDIPTGGAISAAGAGNSFVASHCAFSGNTSTSAGAISVTGGTLVLENCTFSANTGSTASALHLPGTRARIEFCTFGGGIGGASPAAAVITGAGPASGSQLELRASIFFDNYRADGTTPSSSVSTSVVLASLGYNTFNDAPSGTIASDTTNATTLGSLFLPFADYAAGTAWVSSYEFRPFNLPPVDSTPTTASGAVPPPEHDTRGNSRIHALSADRGAHEWSAELVDNDADGLPDWWELQHGLDPSVPDDVCSDLDDDGSNLRDEFLWRTDPANPASVQIVTLNPGGVFQFRAIAGYTYVVETSRNLASWGDRITIVAAGPILTVPFNTALDRNFIRVRRR